MVDEPVDGGRRELVVPEHGAPLPELDVRGHDHAALLVAVAHDLEQQPAALDVERHVAELVEDDEVGLGHVPERRLERVLAARLREHEHELGGREEAHGAPRLHARAADGDRQVGLAAPGRPVEDEVLRGVDERQRHEVAGAVALGERDLREVVALERLGLRERRLPVEPGALVALPHTLLGGYEAADAPDLGGRSARQERLDRLVREEHRLGERPEALGVVPAADRHRHRPLAAPSAESYSDRSTGSS